jgi:hypothetical protein
MKHDVAYFHCEACGSLQTEDPYWLEEAYSNGNLASIDTGAVARNLDCQAMVYAVARILRMPRGGRVLDFGGGNGLLCRLLRDRTFNARVLDNYAANDFAQGFEDDGSKYNLICAFEVAEHFANPQREMALIFERSDSIVIIGTETYTGQGSDWWYLTPTSGQHVFFYSRKGMELLAETHGYHYKPVRNLHIFSRQSFTKIEDILLSSLLSSLRWVRAYLAFSMSFEQAGRDMTLFMKNDTGCVQKPYR